MMMTLQLACDSGSFWCDVRLRLYDGRDLHPLVLTWACDPEQLEERLVLAMNRMAEELAAQGLIGTERVLATLRG